MGRRSSARDESDDSEREEERSSDEEDDGSSEGGSDSGDSDSDDSGDDENNEEEDDDEGEDAEKLARVARDVEQMRAMCAEMDKMKLRLQFRLNTAREAKKDALRREAEQRERSERRQAAAADFDAPQPPVPSIAEPVADEQPPPPVNVMKADVCVQTDCDMAEMDRMEASRRVMSTPSERTAPNSPSKSNTFRIDPAVNESSRVIPASIDDRSPALSIYDLDKSDGVDDRRANGAESAFYDHVLTGMSRSKKMDTIPSVSSQSERSATPDQQSWLSIRGRQVEDSFTRNSTHHTVKSSFDNRPPTAERSSRDNSGAELARGSDQYGAQRSVMFSHGTFDAQDSLRAPLSPSSTASADKTDEQRELEAIQSLLFGR